MKPKLIPITITLFLVGGGGIGYYYWKKGQANGHAKSYSEVKSSRGDVLLSVQATGTVQPENRLIVKAPINGRIDTIFVKEGIAVKANQMLAQMSSTDRAALLDAARAKGPKEVKYWEGIYKPTPIFSPINGVIITRNVEPGQVITSADPVFSMSDHLIIMAQVDETDIAKVKINQDVVVILDAYSAERIKGKVIKIAFDARTVNNVTIYDVQVEPDRVPEFMRSGMTANVKFKVDQRDQVIVIPESAVKRSGERAFVIVPTNGLNHKENNEDADIQPKELDIVTGLSDGKQIEVVSGLTEGQVILQEIVKLPEAKTGGGSPFSPMGQGKNPQRGR